MNEKIKLLAEQAGLTVLTTHGMEDVVDGCYVIAPARLEKFAELIVRECISQIALIGVSNFENPDIMWTIETAISSIEKHFGVEE